MKIVRAICAILAIAGLAIVTLALQDYRARSRFAAEAAQANGEITEVTRHLSSGMRKGNTTYYRFRVRFSSANGEPVEAHAMETSSSPRFAVGEKVPLLYARANPREVNIDDFAMLWADVVVLLIVAAVLLVAGGTAYWIAGGHGGRRAGRTQASLTEMARAWREGRLTRDSEFQPLLVAFAFVVPALLGGIIAFALFAPGVVRAIVAAILAWVAIRVVRDKRRARAAQPQRR